MITKENLLEFGKIGHQLAMQDVFIDDLILSFDLVNSDDSIIVYTTTAFDGIKKKNVVIAQSDNWDKFILELYELYDDIDKGKLTIDDAYERYEN